MLINDGLLGTTTGLHFDCEVTFAGAIDFCTEKINRDREEAIQLLRQEDSSAHSYFRYGLAHQISRYIGSLSDSFKGIYIHGSSVENSSGPASDIDLIISTTKKVEELELLLTTLSGELEFYYNQLLGTKFFGDDYTGFLDVQLVDESDIKSRRGYGAVLTSVHYAPIKIWEPDNSDKNLST